MKVLIAVDASEAALHACRLVAGYAGDRTALAVTVLQVQRPPLQLSPEPGLDRTVLDEALREEGARQMRPALALLQAAGLAAVGQVHIGPPAETLLEAARGADVLVMGSGRRGALAGYALGSVALRVAPAAGCAVVLVKPGIPLSTQMGQRMRVTVPVDGSRASNEAVRRLVACRSALGELQVDLVHFHAGLSLVAAILPPHDDVVEAWGGREAEAALAVPSELLSAAGIAFETHRVTGAADTAISAFAQSHGADLIAMGCRGTGAMHHLLLGSASLRTAHLSEVPVALLR